MLCATPANTVATSTTPPTISMSVAGTRSAGRRRRAASRGAAPGAQRARRGPRASREPGRCGRAAPPRAPAARAPATSVTGSSPTCTGPAGVDSEPLERGLERPRVGLRGADRGRGDDRLEGSASPNRASTSDSETSQFATTASLTPAAASRSSAGRASAYARNDMESVSDGRSVGTRDAERERVGEQRGALEPQRGERGRVARGRCSARGSGASRRASRPRSGRGRRRGRVGGRAMLQTRRRGLDGDERAHRVERDRLGPAHGLMAPGCSECASEWRSA